MRASTRHAFLLTLGVVALPCVVTSHTVAAVIEGAEDRSAPREVEVVGLDYAFRAPAELPPGRTVFRFINHGKVRHEMNIVLLAPGVTVDQLNAVPDPDKPRDAEALASLSRMIEATVGVLFARPGERGPATLVTDLRPGRTYAIRCVARDSAMAPPHFTQGMYAVLHVTTATPAGAPATTARADTIVAMDYAFRYPRTMSPGPHTLAFVNNGKQRHMALLALLRPGVTTEQLADRVKARQDPGQLFERGEGVLHSFGGAPQPLGVLQVRLLAGRDYALLCFVSDSATAPPHFMLGMYGTIHVAEH
jgi:hypothetical protein